MTFHFLNKSDKVGLVKEYPLAADYVEILYDIDGPLSEDGPATTGSSAFASTSLSSPHTS